MRRIGILASVLAGVVCGGLLFASCGGGPDFWSFESSQNTGTPHSSFVAVWISDSPVDGAEALEVTVDRVELVRGDEVVLLDDTERTFDLLALRNGLRASLAEADVPAADFQAIRLTLREAGSRAPRIRRAGAWQPLVLVPGASRVVDVPHAFSTVANGRREIQIDFNARLSVVDVGGELRLTPVLDAVDPTVAGRIEGRVLDAGGTPIGGAVVLARSGGLELRSTVTRPDGSYTLAPLAPGPYDVELLRPSGTPLAVPNVVVSTGGAPVVRFDLP